MTTKEMVNMWLDKKTDYCATIYFNIDNHNLDDVVQEIKLTKYGIIGMEMKDKIVFISLMR